jgi:hypothetical protein
MLNPKILLKQFGIFWAVFIVLQLIVSTPPVRNGLAGMNASLFSSTAQRFMPEIKLNALAKPENGEILFKFHSQVQADEMIREMQKSGKVAKVSVPEYEYGIDPAYHVNMALIFLVAIFLATPLVWRKRFLLAGIGILLFYLFSFVRVIIKLKYEIGQLNIGLYESDPAGFLSLHKMNNFFNSLGLIFIVIIIFWATLVFTRKNINQMKLQLT